MRTFTTALLLAAALTPAFGGQAPPPKYDQPYTGRLTVTKLKSLDQVRKACQKDVLGCAVISYDPELSNPDGCHIYLAPDSEIRRAQYEPKDVLRHELGHCNGRHATHPD